MTGKTFKANRKDHDECLRVAIDHRDQLTEAELLALNHVAASWAIDEPWLTHADLDEARAIVARFAHFYR